VAYVGLEQLLLPGLGSRGPWQGALCSSPVWHLMIKQVPTLACLACCLLQCDRPVA
jgi:hypothetical protein